MKKKLSEIWTQAQADAAVTTFLAQIESQVVIEKIQRAPENLHEQFEADAKWRLAKASPAALEWWQLILNGCPQSPERIAVNEPFGQRGRTLDDLARRLPAKVSPDALIVAWKRIDGVGFAVGGLLEGISDTRGWTADQVQQHLDEVKKQLDWDNTTGSARKWWEAFENENKSRNALVLRLGEELAVRKATITEFFLAYVYSNTDNIQANLHYLDYTRLKKTEEKRKKETATAAGVETPPHQAARTVEDIFRFSDNAGITDSSGWSFTEVQNDLAKVEHRIDLGNTTGSALKWWHALKVQYADAPSIVLRIAEELSIRKATVTEFFFANLRSNTDDLQAILDYLDYSRLKKEEERKKQEAAAAARAAQDAAAEASAAQ